jgi:hypothetical protein
MVEKETVLIVEKEAVVIAVRLRQGRIVMARLR